MSENSLMTLVRPNLQLVAQTTRQALSQHRLIILVGECHVEYCGRARSILSPGERVVLIKGDGAVLVHRPTGYEPVNWQPSDCRFRTSLSKEGLILEAIRRFPVESLRMVFSRVDVLVASKLLDAGSFDLHVSEKEMQQAIISQPQLLLSDLKPVAFEKPIEPGFIDVYGLDSKGRLVVAELKRVKAGRAAVIQLAKYVDNIKTTSNREVRGILAAPSIAKGTQRLLATLELEFVPIDLERFARVIVSKSERKIVDFLK